MASTGAPIAAYRPATFAGVPLEQPCDRCKTKGYVQHPLWAEWFTQTGGDEEKAPMPDPSISEEMPCPECEGLGSVPTVAGYELLGFLRRRGL